MEFYTIVSYGDIIAMRGTHAWDNAKRARVAASRMPDAKFIRGHSRCCTAVEREKQQQQQPRSHARAVCRVTLAVCPVSFRVLGCLCLLPPVLPAAAVARLS